LIINPFSFSPLSLFPFFFLAALPGLFAAKFPDNAFPSVFAIDAGVGAGSAGVQAFLAVAELHLIADHTAFPLRVKTAFH